MKKIIAALLCIILLAGCTVSQPSSYAVIDENGSYDQKDDVALYLITYEHLPSNYMTKKEARELGWEGGALSQIVDGMCIGGDEFGNYEGILPEEDTYYECDIDTLGKSSRGVKRIVWSVDFDVYYTDDHYQTFEYLYEGEVN